MDEQDPPRDSEERADNHISTLLRRQERQLPPRTPGERRLYAQTTEPRTEEDIDNQLAEDTEYLNWEPVKHPAVQHVERALGLPQDRSLCWGCSHLVGGGGKAVGDARKIQQFEQMYTDRGFMEDSVLAREMAAFFEREIRQPINTTQNLQEPIPEWTAASILDHFTHHIQSPEAWRFKNIQTFGRIADMIVDNGLYRRNRSTDEVRIHPVSLKMLLEVHKADKALRAQRTETMLLHRPEARGVNTNQSFLRRKEGTRNLKQMRSIVGMENSRR